MSRFRAVVLPTLRLMIWAVIAIALCVIAFGGGSKADDALSPEIGDSTSVVPVTKGDIQSVIEVHGTVKADPAVTVKATSSGTVSRVRVEKGDSVSKGDALFDVRVELPPAAQTNPEAPPAPTRYTTKLVRATASGKLTEFDVLRDQETQVGTEVGKISPGTLTVTAPLTQAQQFRLLQPPASASAQAPGGPAPFECGNVRTGTPENTTTSQQNQQSADPFGGSETPEQSTAEVSCTIPSGTTVFAGMSVDLTLHTGSVAGVLTLPVTAVQGTVGTGKVWTSAPADGAPLEKTVALGLTDGQRVEIVNGLAEGDEVLEFAPVPSDDSKTGDGEQQDMYGG